MISGYTQYMERTTSAEPPVPTVVEVVIPSTSLAPIVTYTAPSMTVWWMAMTVIAMLSLLCIALTISLMCLINRYEYLREYWQRGEKVQQCEQGIEVKESDTVKCQTCGHENVQQNEYIRNTLNANKDQGNSKGAREKIPLTESLNRNYKPDCDNINVEDVCRLKNMNNQERQRYKSKKNNCSDDDGRDRDNGEGSNYHQVYVQGSAEIHREDLHLKIATPDRPRGQQPQETLHMLKGTDERGKTTGRESIPNSHTIDLKARSGGSVSDAPSGDTVAAKSNHGSDGASRRHVLSTVSNGDVNHFGMNGVSANTGGGVNGASRGDSAVNSQSTGNVTPNVAATNHTIDPNLTFNGLKVEPPSANGGVNGAPRGDSGVSSQSIGNVIPNVAETDHIIDYTLTFNGLKVEHPSDSMFDSYEVV